MIATAPTISVPLHTDEHGRVRIANTRVTINVVIACYQHGDTPESIHEGFPTVSLADIYAVVAYYLNNQDELDAFLRKQDEEDEEYLRKMEAEHPEMFTLQNKLRQRLGKRDE